MSLNAIFAMGDDAMNTEGYVTIRPLSFMSKTGNLYFRATSYAIPEFKTELQTVNFMTDAVGIPKPCGNMEGEFNLTFRADKYYLIYCELLRWKRLISDNKYSTAFPFSSNLSTSFFDYMTTDILVNTQDTRGIATSTGWRFTEAFPVSIGQIQFNQASTGEPIEITVGFHYGNCYML